MSNLRFKNKFRIQVIHLTDLHKNHSQPKRAHRHESNDGLNDVADAYLYSGTVLFAQHATTSCSDVIHAVLRSWVFHSTKCFVKRFDLVRLNRQLSDRIRSSTLFKLIRKMNGSEKLGRVLSKLANPYFLGRSCGM